MTPQIKKYLVTFTERVTVHARSASEAESLAFQAVAFVGADTEDIEVEEIEDD